MTPEDAAKILRIMATADSSCQVCAGSLFRQFIREWSEHTEIAKEIWRKEFESELVFFTEEGGK